MSALPEIIGEKYRVTAQIGKGGMATVYSAVHVGTDRHVAVKVMTVTEDATELDPETSSTPNRGGSLMRFAREARIAGNIETQHVTRVFDTGLDPIHGPYIVMELLRGEDVKDLVRRLGPLRPELALRIVAQACIGIGRAHAVGVVHRDVKASNLFLAEGEFGNRVVKVLDFGIAKGRLNDHVDAVDSKTLTKTGAMLGSPHYMSPEQVLGTKALDHRADIWSLGIVLYKCLSARTPFDDRDTVGQLIVSIVQGSPPSVQDFAPWVPPEIASIVGGALRLRPDDRFQTADAMAQAIRSLLPKGELDILPEMLTPMTDEERQDVKPRLSTRVTLPDGPLGSRRRSPSGRVVEMASNASPQRQVNEADSTIGSATASTRRPSTSPRSPRSKVGAAAITLAAGGAVIWGLAHRAHVQQPAAASSGPLSVPTDTAAAMAPAPPQTAGADAVGRVVEVHVVPPTSSVEVDDVAATVKQGAVEVAGVLGSVHKVRLRSGGREATMEVIVSEDGARPRIVTLPDPRSASPASVPHRAPGLQGPPGAQATPAPAKSAARFETQFE
ncbi:MAG: serine/threonine-protein kinase [Polyangiaceae bacterium]